MDKYFSSKTPRGLALKTDALLRHYPVACCVFFTLDLACGHELFSSQQCLLLHILSMCHLPICIMVWGNNPLQFLPWSTACFTSWELDQYSALLSADYKIFLTAKKIFNLTVICFGVAWGENEDQDCLFPSLAYLQWPHHLYWMLLLNGVSWAFPSTGSLVGKDSSVMTRDSEATPRITWFQAPGLCLEMLRASMVHGTLRSPAWLLSHHRYLASCKGHKDNLVFSWGGCADLRDPLRLALSPYPWLLLCILGVSEFHIVTLFGVVLFWFLFLRTHSVLGLQWDTLITMWKTRGISLEIRLSSIQSLIIVHLHQHTTVAPA